jgi:hypothetical protein
MPSSTRSDACGVDSVPYALSSVNLTVFWQGNLLGRSLQGPRSIISAVTLTQPTVSSLALYLADVYTYV